MNAISSESTRRAAAKRTEAAKDKLHRAELELHEANAGLASAIPEQNDHELVAAHEKTLRAERKVHQATNDLEVVSALLTEPVVDAATQRVGRSGEGLHSVIDGLRRRR